MDAAHFEEIQTNTVVRKRLAKLMAKNCFRNTRLEDLHSRISDQEMKVLMIDVVDHCYDFLMELCSPHGDAIIDDLKRRDAVPEWDDPEIRIS
jgi:hypothetical protein